MEIRTRLREILNQNSTDKLDLMKRISHESFPDQTDLIDEQTNPEDLFSLVNDWTRNGMEKSDVKVVEVIRMCQKMILSHMFNHEFTRNIEPKVSLIKLQILENYSKQFKLIDVYSQNYNKILSFDYMGRKHHASVDNIWEVYKFTSPVIEVNNKGEIVQKYKNISEGDLLYIWQTLTKTGVEHLAAQIVTKRGENYSFGFGHEGNSNLLQSVPGVFYTPDYGLNYKFQSQKEENGNRVYINLISVTEIRQQHLQSLNNALDQVTELSSVGIEFDEITDITTTGEIYPKLTRTNAGLDFFISPKKSNQQQRIKLSEIQINFNYSWKHPSEYCTISGVSTHKTNCASFIKTIFGDVIECGFYENLITDPKKCHHNSKYPIQTCLS